MSQETIPDNNLPVYLQQYDVNILNVDLPKCLIGGCQGTEFGCCCDKITPAIDASQSNCIGGCCGTEFGCCPYSTEARKDSQGSNCGTIAGSVLYTTVGAIPSNVPKARVWDLNLTGYLQPNVDKYYIVYDFTNVNYKDKEEITFENKLSGTFNICGRVLDASKLLDYKFCDAKLTLTIIINARKFDFRLKKEVLFSFAININDTTCQCFSRTTNDTVSCLSLPGSGCPQECEDCPSNWSNTQVVQNVTSNVTYTSAGYCISCSDGICGQEIAYSGNGCYSNFLQATTNKNEKVYIYVIPTNPEQQGCCSSSYSVFFYDTSFNQVGPSTTASAGSSTQSLTYDGITVKDITITQYDTNPPLYYATFQVTTSSS